jgi:hypothetical protein
VSDAKISQQQGATGGVGESVDQTTTFQRKDGTYQTPSVVDGVQTLKGGTNTASSAPVISSPGFAIGTASQLSDTSRDYMVYLQIGTAGTAYTLKIGPTSTPANTIFASATPVSETLHVVRLPAGWYLEAAGTSTTIANQIAIGC